MQLIFSIQLIINYKNFFILFFVLEQQIEVLLLFCVPVIVAKNHWNGITYTGVIVVCWWNIVIVRFEKLILA